MPARRLLRGVPRRAARPLAARCRSPSSTAISIEAVPRRSCHDPRARNIEVTAGHLGLLTEPAAFHEVTTALVYTTGEPGQPLAAPAA
jgi:hypothetical protein